MYTHDLIGTYVLTYLRTYVRVRTCVAHRRYVLPIDIECFLLKRSLAAIAIIDVIVPIACIRMYSSGTHVRTHARVYLVPTHAVLVCHKLLIGAIHIGCISVYAAPCGPQCRRCGTQHVRRGMRVKLASCDSSGSSAGQRRLVAAVHSPPAAISDTIAIVVRILSVCPYTVLHACSSSSSRLLSVFSSPGLRDGPRL